MATGRPPTKPFLPGNTLGAAGRIAGSLNKISVLLDQMAAGKAEKIFAKLLQMAEDGDRGAAEAILSRLWPVRQAARSPSSSRRSRPASDVAAALSSLLRNVSEGELSPEEGTAVAGIVEAKRRALETVELEKRLHDLELRVAGGTADE